MQPNLCAFCIGESPVHGTDSRYLALTALGSTRDLSGGKLSCATITSESK